jgi:glutamyl-tRNA(Gln) amidotransferase subunit E
MLTPDEVAEAAQYLRMLVRTSGKVRTGLGAARQDVNVSIDGGTRVEIKGVAHIKWIPELTHVEAFRQKALLLIRDELRSRVKDSTQWQLASVELDPDQCNHLPTVVAENMQPEHKLIAINLPQFSGLLSFFTQPGHCFAGELSDRLKVIACIERPNLVHSENSAWFGSDDAAALSNLVGAKDGDAQLLLWGPADDIKTALETIEERCLLAFDGVPNETRKSLPDGTTIFERVLPGPNRMYPDTDSAPIAIDEARIEQIRGGLVHELPAGLDKLRTWNIPEDAHHYLIVGGLVAAIEEIVAATKWPEKFVALLFAHTLKGWRRKYWTATEVTNAMVVKLCCQLAEANYDRNLAKEALSILCADPSQTLADVIASIPVGKCSVAAALDKLPALTKQFETIRTSVAPESEARWAVGQLRAELSHDVDPGDLARAINGGQANG